MLQLIHYCLKGGYVAVQRVIKEFIISNPFGSSCNYSSEWGVASNAFFTPNSSSFQFNPNQLHNLSLCIYYVLGILNHNIPCL